MTETGSILYKDENREKTTQLAESFMLPNDIADILNLDRVWFIGELKEHTSDFYKAFYGGYLKKKYELKKNVPNLSKDEAEVQLTELRTFEAKLIIQLDAQN